MKLIKRIWNFISRIWKGNKGTEPTSCRANTAPAIGSKTQYWYGRVNYWSSSFATLKKEIKYMKSVGLAGYVMEFAEWRYNNTRICCKKTDPKYIELIEHYKKYYKYIHDLCVQNGLWLFVCIVNDNALTSKHGNKAQDPKHFYNDLATDLLNIVLSQSPANVIVQPVSELYSARVKNHPGPAWQKNALKKLKAKKFLTCTNDSYGRPTSQGGMDYMAWHPNNIKHFPDKLAKTKTFIISDTGGIISEMNGGTDCDKVDANCKPSKIKEWRKNCKGYAVCGYYDFMRKSYNEAAIKAMAGK